MPVLLLVLAAPGAAQETWTATSTVGAPSARSYQTAVWTGTKMIVWGGESDAGDLNSGGIYDPATNTWRATSPTNVPTARYMHTAVWTGTKMIVWGGHTTVDLNTGGIYNPATNLGRGLDSPSLRDRERSSSSRTSIRRSTLTQRG
jgi:hypothetical protein